MPQPPSPNGTPTSGPHAIMDDGLPGLLSLVGGESIIGTKDALRRRSLRPVGAQGRSLPRFCWPGIMCPTSRCFPVCYQALAISCPRLIPFIVRLSTLEHRKSSWPAAKPVLIPEHRVSLPWQGVPVLGFPAGRRHPLVQPRPPAHQQTAKPTSNDRATLLVHQHVVSASTSSPLPGGRHSPRLPASRARTVGAGPTQSFWTIGHIRLALPGRRGPAPPVHTEPDHPARRTRLPPPCSARRRVVPCGPTGEELQS